MRVGYYTHVVAFFSAIALVCASAALIAPSTLHAQTAAEIRQQIADHNVQIDAMEKEIAKHEVELKNIGDKKQTLQNTIDQLNLLIKKTTTQISLTKNQISTLQLEIKQLAGDINNKQHSIDVDRAGLGESIRRLNEVEMRPLAQSLLSSGSISESWKDAEDITALQDAVNENIAHLAKEKKSLAETKTKTEGKRTELLKRQNTLVAQQGSLSATKKAQSDLLKETKAQESVYQDILAQKKTAKASFEQALSNLNAKLQFVVDASQVTPAGKGVLQYPLDSVRITQYFGNTAFALAGAYNGKGHNGMDFAASIGTPIRAALTGEVVGTGNTDAVRGCYSFGKWVMIKHGNGLSTMYAHLSQISVSSGQAVATGEVIGYSGETGYATGPHLHFGVYVTSATQIMKLGDATQSKTPCANAVMPVAPLSGYLNPTNYL